MRVLTVRQPWAWAIVHGGKDVENRRTNVVGSHRGPLAIHASSFRSVEYIQDAIASPYFDPAVLRERHVLPPRLRGETAGGVFVPGARHLDELSSTAFYGAPLALGVILGVVDVVDVHDDGSCVSTPAEERGALRFCSTWAMPYHRHIVLANPRPLATPIAISGQLGMWSVRDELIAASS